MGKASALTTSVMQQSSTKMDILLITNGRYTPPSATREISTSSQIITMEEIICSCKSAMAYKHLYKAQGCIYGGRGGFVAKIPVYIPEASSAQQFIGTLTCMQVWFGGMALLSMAAHSRRGRTLSHNSTALLGATECKLEEVINSL